MYVKYCISTCHLKIYAYICTGIKIDFAFYHPYN